MKVEVRTVEEGRVFKDLRTGGRWIIAKLKEGEAQPSPPPTETEQKKSD
jgi:hypothetical protein